jgi:hypothetical protein
MSVNMQSTKHAKWTTRLWRTLAALDEATSVSPMEHLESASQFWNRNCGPEVSRRALTGNRSPPKRLMRIGVILSAIKRDRVSTSLRGGIGPRTPASGNTDMFNLKE